ncbi:MAG: NusA N-terminal domain-containing protein [Bacilli bacterium]
MSEEEMNIEKTVEAPVKAKRGRKAKKTEDLNKITGKVDSDSFISAIGEIQKDSMVSNQDVANLLASAMEQAYVEWSYPGLFRDRDSADPVKELVKANVVFEDDYHSFKIFDVKTVCNEDDIIDDSYQISLEDAQEIDAAAKLGDSVEIPFDVKLLNKSYVRRVKQLFMSKLKDSSRQAVLNTYSTQIGGLIEGEVTAADPMNNTYELSFGKASGTLKRGSLIPQDSFATHERVLVYLADVSDKTNPPSLVISRSNEKFIQKLLEKNIPELYSGAVRIRNISREAGRRCKVFVEATVPNIDPIGTCIGPESSRIKAVLSPLHGEKVDILNYRENKALQIIEAMKPATVIGMTCPDDFFDENVHYEELEKEPDYEYPRITVVVMNGNQGVAIGSAGVNVRLASKITQCTISVLQADDAIKQGLKYTLTQEIEKLAKVETPVEPEAVIDEPISEEEEIPAEENQTFADAEKAVETVSQTTEPETVAEQETKPAQEETPVAPVSEPEAAKEPEPAEAPVEHIEIKNKPKISLAELERAISQKKKTSSEGNYYKKKWNKNDKDEKKQETSVAAQTAAMPIYTEEELKQLDEQGEESPFDYDDTNLDLDDFDEEEYYKDNK